jgi:hypothetical protein
MGKVVLLGVVFLLVMGCDRSDIPTLTGTVTINGTAKVGETLTADISKVNGEGTIAYQWLRGEATEIGNGGSSYVLVKDDIDFKIKVKVSRMGYDGTLSSEPTAIVDDSGTEQNPITDFSFELYHDVLEFATNPVAPGSQIGEFGPEVGGIGPFVYSFADGNGSIDNRFFDIVSNKYLAVKSTSNTIIVAKTYSILVKVTDSKGYSFTKNFTFEVIQPRYIEIPDTEPIMVYGTNNGNIYYYIYHIGKIERVPLAWGAAKEFSGLSSITFDFSHTYVSENSVSTAETNATSRMRSVEQTASITSAIEANMGLEIDGLSSGFKTSVSATMGASVGAEIQIASEYQKTAAYTYGLTQSIRETYPLEKNIAYGWYRFTVITTSDAYAILKYNTEDEKWTYDFFTCPRQSDIGYMIEYSEHNNTFTNQVPASTSSARISFDADAAINNIKILDNDGAGTFTYEVKQNGVLIAILTGGGGGGSGGAASPASSRDDAYARAGLGADGESTVLTINNGEPYVCAGGAGGHLDVSNGRDYAFDDGYLGPDSYIKNGKPGNAGNDTTFSIPVTVGDRITITVGNGGGGGGGAAIHSKVNSGENARCWANNGNGKNGGSTNAGAQVNGWGTQGAGYWSHGGDAVRTGATGGGGGGGNGSGGSGGAADGGSSFASYQSNSGGTQSGGNAADPLNIGGGIGGSTRGASGKGGKAIYRGSGDSWCFATGGGGGAAGGFTLSGIELKTID